MAWPSPNNDGASNNNSRGHSQFTQEQLNEVRAFNAGLTRAGQKSRPGARKAAPAPHAINQAGSGSSPYARGGISSTRGVYGGTAASGASYAYGRGGMSAASPTRGPSTFGGHPGRLDNHFVSAASTPSSTPSTFPRSEPHRHNQNDFNTIAAPHLTAVSAPNRSNPFPSGSYSDGTTQVSSGPCTCSTAAAGPQSSRTSLAVGSNTIPSESSRNEPATARVASANSTWGAASAPAPAPSTSWNTANPPVGYNGGPASTQGVSNTVLLGGVSATLSVSAASTQEQCNSFLPGRVFNAGIAPVQSTTAPWDSATNSSSRQNSSFPPAPVNNAQTAVGQNSSWGAPPVNQAIPMAPNHTQNNPFPGGTDLGYGGAHGPSHNTSWVPHAAAPSAPAAGQGNSNLGVQNHGPSSTRDNPFPLGAYNDGTAGTPATSNSDVVPVQVQVRVRGHPRTRTHTRAESVASYSSSSDPFAVGGPLRPFEDPNYYNPNRQRIVNNWGPDQPGPFLPAHFAQRSAMDAIVAIHQETGIPFDELTSDGISMPARPRAVDQPIAANQLPSAFEQIATFQQAPPVPAQASFQPVAPAAHAGPASSTANGRQADISTDASFNSLHQNWGRPTCVTSGDQSSMGVTSHLEDVVMDAPATSNRPLLDGEGRQKAGTPSLVPSGSGIDGLRLSNLAASRWAPKSEENARMSSTPGLTATARPIHPTVTPNALVHPPTPAFGAAAPTTANVLPPHMRPGNSNKKTTREPGKSDEKHLSDSMWA